MKGAAAYMAQVERPPVPAPAPALTPLLAALLAALLASCAPLEEIAPQTCGNGVLEPGEDCDTFARSPATSCGTVGTEHACRYVCTRESGAAGRDEPVCPEGWGCGLDGLCRQPSGRYSAPLAVLSFATMAMDLVDFDGDGRDDLLARARPDLLGQSLAHVYFAPVGGEGFAGLAIPLLLGSPAVGDLTGDGLADLVFVHQLSGIALLAGRGDRSLAPVPSPTITAELKARGAVLAVDVLERERVGTLQPGRSFRHVGDEILLFWSEESGSYLITTEDPPEEARPRCARNPSAAECTGLLLHLDTGPAQLASPLQAAPLIEGAGSPCPEIVIALRDAPQVEVFQPCRRQGASFDWNFDGRSISIPLPQGTSLSAGLLVADLNYDGHLDLLVAAMQRAQKKLVWCMSFGDGAGGFFADPLLRRGHPGFALLEDGQAEEFPLVGLDVNGDGLLDYLTPHALLVSTLGEGDLEVLPGQPRYTVRALRAFGAWVEGVAGDFNGDGALDLAASSGTTQEIDLLLGDGQGTFTALAIPTQGAPAHLRQGDFDGDRVSDLAFAELAAPDADEERGDPGGAARDTFAILFGSRDGPVAGFVRLGQFARINDIVVAELQLDLLVPHPDGADDLLVVAEEVGGQHASIYLLEGNAARLPVSALRPSLESIPLAPLLGRFDGEAGTDIVVLGQDLFSDPACPPPPAMPECGKGGPTELVAGLLQQSQTFCQRLWLSSWTGSAPGVPRPSPPVRVRWLDCDNHRPLNVAVADLDGNGRDELVGLQLVPAGEEAGAGRATVLLQVDPTAGEGSWQEITLESSELSFAVDAPPLLLPRDVDGDRFPDLVTALAQDAEAEEKDGALLVLWNDGRGGLSSQRATTVALPGAGRVRALAAGRLDPRRLYAASQQGVFFLSGSKEDPRRLSARKLEDVDGGVALAVGDVDGDRLDDLAVGGPEGIRIQQAEEVQR